MNRNWGLSGKNQPAGLRDAKTAKPAMTLFVSAVYGIFGAATAAISFAEARLILAGLFHGASLVATIVAAGFGCWVYIWLARPRLAAQFTGKGDAFSTLLRFYARAAFGLIALMAIAFAASVAGLQIPSVLGFCIAGGAGAAAAFQTVLAFVPYYEEDGAARK